MKLTNYNIEWSYKARKVWISHQGDMTFSNILGADKIYDIHSSGCCYLNWKKKELENVYRLFTSLIREGFNVEETYREFLKINKFRQNEEISILDIILA